MNKKVLITILTILGLAVVTGGFWCVKSQQKENVVIKEKQEQNRQMNNEKENENQKQEEQKKEEDEGENNKELDFKKIDTSNWKEYCNKEYGFCVKYPEGWEYSKTKSTISSFLFEYNHCKRMNTPFNECSYFIDFRYYKHNDLEKLIGYTPKDVFQWRKNDFKNLNIKNKRNAIVLLKGVNYNVIKFHFQSIEDNHAVDSYYFIDNKKNGWNIVVKYTNDAEKTILNKILNTFNLVH